MPASGGREKSALKRGPASSGEREDAGKKPRRSERLSQVATPISHKNPQFPSPVTHRESTTGASREGTITPPEGRPSQIKNRAPPSPPGLPSSPPNETQTQAFSQFLTPSESLTQSVVDEEAEGVWGYLVPLDRVFGETLVLRSRHACPVPAPGTFGKGAQPRAKGVKNGKKEEEQYEDKKAKTGFPAGGYLIGRHLECDRRIERPTVSNRHCLLFSESRDGKSIALVEDLSSNGTFVNGTALGRNKRMELQDNDRISILEETTFMFRYPARRDGTGFQSQYRVLNQLGKGHFASVYLCVDKTTGMHLAVKRFEKRPGDSERVMTEGLQQEIAVLMGINHPNLLCLKSTFDEKDAVYLVLELASEGELFNWIVMKQKLTEDETRKVFIQLFQAVKYLHERGIVHRDIKPENILLADKDLSVKLADFGLAKIIGEESFTTTLCGTPSYVAPEILENTRHRRYTRAVDVWSLGVVLYICLCGFPPFSDELYTRENPYRLSEQIKMGKFDYPSPYWDSVGDPALDLIDRMLTVDPEKRITVDECLEHPWISQRGGFESQLSLTDSTDGLTGALGKLDFEKRKLARERTLISDLNSVMVSNIIESKSANDSAAVKVWDKNGNIKNGQGRQINAQQKQQQQQQPANGKDGSNKKENKAGGEANQPKKINGGDGSASTADNGNASTASNGKKAAAATKASKAKKEPSPGAERDPAEFMEMGGKGDQQLFGTDSSSIYP